LIFCLIKVADLLSQWLIFCIIKVADLLSQWLICCLNGWWSITR
jgi:hypothetical protein